MRYAVIYALPLMLSATVAFADDYAPPSAAGGSKSTVTGTIEGEVKKVQPDAVIIERDKDGQEVRLQMHESTHKGDIKEGDKVEAFVTPGGTTTSVQPKTGGFNR
jgi:hypothetical protein